MSEEFSWQCPYCNQHATITSSNYSEDSHTFDKKNKDGLLRIYTTVIVCPNGKCQEYTIKSKLHKLKYIGSHLRPDEKPIMRWNMRPNSFAKSFPLFIPSSVLEDYQEACLIRDLSPKASATLSRRCLQGMIRDYWKIEKKRTLFEEVTSIKDMVDPSVFAAIDAVREVGNIGAHMEQDINLIIEVDPEEAQLLIGLIEHLLKEWYVARNERDERLKMIIDMANNKKEQKKSLSVSEDS
jgi:hypothetical protein